MRMRSELILLAVFFAVMAGLILYRSQTPTLMTRSVPQTTVTQTETQITAQWHSRYAVDVNRATFDELMGVRGMTEKIAQGILEYRAEHGRFFTPEDLLQVPGIGSVTLEKLLPYITIDP